MKYSSRFFLYAPLGVLLALIAVVSGHWWLAASALSERLKAVNGHEVMPGVTMRFAPPRISGFPFTLDTVLRDMTIEVATPHGPTRWTSNEFAMHALTYGRDETIFEAAGPQVLVWTRDDGSRRTLNFDVGSLHASAISGSHGLKRFDLDIIGFGSSALTARRLQFHIRANPGADTLDYVVDANDVRFSPADSPDLGDQIAEAHIDGSITQARTTVSLRAGTARWFDAAEDWRKAAGVLRVASCSLAWSGLSIKGSGQLALDEAHGPAGALRFDISGFGRFQARAVRQRLKRGPNTGLAGALLDRGADPDGHANAVLAFKNGAIFLGGERADTTAPLY